MTGTTQKDSGKALNPVRGERFIESADAAMDAINASIGFDKRLYHADIAASRAHCEMLVKQGIVEAEDGRAIVEGLALIEQEIDDGLLIEEPALEDIHMHIEARLRSLIGEAAGRLHTARSRNDQAVTDLRLWLRDAIGGIDKGLVGLLRVLIGRAESEAATVMPGFTHLQVAQPVTLGHHLMAYVEMFRRDRGRLADTRARLNECPLGAAALAGTSFPIDRAVTASALGFDRPTRNSIDSVSDRDFCLEFLSAAAICGIHLSRLAEEIILWATPQFGFVRLADGFSTGSSIMPQKRNPDAAELIRGKSGRLIGDLAGLLVTLKGLPLAYAKDMQEDKEPLFDAVDTLSLCLAAMRGMIASAEFNRPALLAAANSGYATATDLADWLVRALDMPFREAHRISGLIVRLAEDKGLALESVALADLQAIEPRIEASVFDVLGAARSVASRTSFGGTAPQNVIAAARAAKEAL